MSVHRLLRRSVPWLFMLCFVASAGPVSGAAISVTEDMNKAAAATFVVSITGPTLTFSPDPVKVSSGDNITWSLSASALQAGEAKAEIVIGGVVVAGPSVPGLLSGGYLVPALPSGTVIKYTTRFRTAANVLTRTFDPDIVVTPGLGPVGLALLSLILAGLGAAVLMRRRTRAPQAA